MPAQENAITKTFDLIVYLIPILEKFPRSQKYILGDRVETKMLEIQEKLIEAYYTKQNKVGILRAVNIQIEQLRYLVRLLHEMKYMNTEKYGTLSEKINEIGRMCGGWEKAMQTK